MRPVFPALIAPALLLAACVDSEARTLPSSAVTQIFAAHDCCGRLADSRIEYVGTLQSGRHKLAVYDLWFVNPQSRHGMRHVAFVEGRQFRGSYNISSWSAPKIAGNRVRFFCRPNSADICDASFGEDLVVDDGILPSKLWVDGEVNPLEDTI